MPYFFFRAKVTVTGQNRLSSNVPCLVGTFRDKMSESSEKLLNNWDTCNVNDLNSPKFD